MFAGSLHFDGCDYELSTYQALRTYGPLKQKPDEGGVFIRILLKVKNVGSDPKRIDFTEMHLRDAKGRQFSYAGVGDPLNLTDIQPGFSYTAEIVFMVPQDVALLPMALIVKNGLWSDPWSDPKTFIGHLPRLTTVLDN